jgi:hypothetical protein
MAKSSLPRIDGEQPRQLERTQATMNVETPPASEGYIPRNVHVKMNRSQAKTLRDKLRSLQDQGARTADGKFVDNRAQVVRWMLENTIR